MKKIIIVMLLALVSLGGRAQVTFQKELFGTDSTNNTKILQNADGSYIIAGNKSTDGMPGGVIDTSDIFLIKINPAGNVLWSKTYGGNGADAINKIEKTNDGGFVLIGNTNSFGAGTFDMYVIKTDSVGDTLWTKAYGQTYYDYGNDIQQTTDGGYIITGYGSNNPGPPYASLYLIKTNSIGDTLWTRIFDDTISDAAWGSSVKQTSDGGYVVLGTSPHMDSILSYHDAAYLLKTDANGNELWSKKYAQNTDDVAVQGIEVFETNDGGYVLSGLTVDYSVGDAITNDFLLKTDNSGNTIWSHGYQINGDSWENFLGNVIQTNDGGFAFSYWSWVTDTIPFDTVPGGAHLNIHLNKLDSNGVFVWGKSYGKYLEDEYGTYLQQTSDGGYILAGNTDYFSLPISDIYLIKTDSLGNSGCTEYNDTSIAGYNPNYQINNVVTLQSSGCIVHSTQTIVSNGIGGPSNDYCLTVSIPEILNPDSEISLFPNPATSTITITTTGTKIKEIKIMNVLGEIANSQQVTGNSATIDISTLDKGIYFVQITEENKKVSNRKIVVQ